METKIEIVEMESGSAEVRVNTFCRHKMSNVATAKSYIKMTGGKRGSYKVVKEAKAFRLEGAQPVLILEANGAFASGEHFYCGSCGSACAVNAVGVSSADEDFWRHCSYALQGTVVGINVGRGSVDHVIVDGPLEECSIGYGWDEGIEGAREEECSNCYGTHEAKAS